MQIPIGHGSKFQGVVDLITEKAIYWEDDLGKELRYEAVPDELEEVHKTEREMVERIAELDDDLIQKFLDNEEITI